MTSGCVLMGEDVGIYGGAFKVTEGMLQRFGEWRMIDTPISESGFVGAAIGAALMGLRPVVEMQFADFISCAFDQITEVAAKAVIGGARPCRWWCGHPSAAGFMAGRFTTKSGDDFVHSPGLKVVCPVLAYDAKGLLIKAIRDPDPVFTSSTNFCIDA